MPQCTFHPNVETNVRCVECDRHMCPKDYVNTPVGYKCRECARPLPSARRTVKPKQLAFATLAALAVGVGGAFLLAVIGIHFWLAPVLLGMLTGETARRASGGHRTAAIATVAGLAVLLGTYFTGVSYFATALGAGAAVYYVMQNRW